MGAENDPWSWRKLLKGPIIGKNYAKAGILTLCQLIILGIIFCAVYTARSIISRNSGTITQTETKIDSHNKTEQKTGVRFQLFGIG